MFECPIEATFSQGLLIFFCEIMRSFAKKNEHNNNNNREQRR